MSSAHILVVDDEPEIGALLRDILVDEGHRVTVAGNAAQARAARTDCDLILLDIWMPDADGISLLREWSADGLRCPVVMMSGHGTIDAAVEATRLGAFDFIEKPLSLSKLLNVVQQALDSSRLRKQMKQVLARAPAAPSGRSQVMQALREQAQRAAASGAPVLLLGEPGAGRETLARYLHEHSDRAARPLMQLTPASISDDSAALELYGGPAQPGLLAQAQGSTLYIKGLEDISPALQRLLLAALETGQYTPLAATLPVKLDVRLVCSTQSNFLNRSAEWFRTDLLMRLNTLTLQVPALRERSEDVPELLRFYAERLADEEHLPLRRFGMSAQNRLRNYPWPGNVQELRNLVRRLLILGGGEEIRLDELERELSAQTPEGEPLVKQDLLALPLREAREHFERAYLQQQLLLCNGKVGQLAKRVGMERTHLYRKLRMLGVDFRSLGEE